MSDKKDKKSDFWVRTKTRADVNIIWPGSIGHIQTGFELELFNLLNKCIINRKFTVTDKHEIWAETIEI